MAQHNGVARILKQLGDTLTLEIENTIDAATAAVQLAGLYRLLFVQMASAVYSIKPMQALEAPPNTAIVNQIIDCAQELVQSRGYNAFSFRDLAQRVGIKSASVHYYFPTKGDLARALVVRYRAQFGAHLSRISESQGDATAHLEAYCDLIYRSFALNNLICLCGMLATDAASLPDAAQREVRGFFEDNEIWLGRLLERGRATGEFGFAGEPSATAASMFAAIQGAMVSAYTFGDASRLQNALDWLRATLR